MSNETILNRLRKGQVWLISEARALRAMPDMGVGTAREAMFVKMFLTWADLEHTLRFLEPETGCVMGSQCDPQALILCETCSSHET